MNALSVVVNAYHGLGGLHVVQFAIGVYAFKLDREPLRPLWALSLQQFVYRQLMYLVIVESSISAIQGARSDWRNLAHTGEVGVGS